MEKIKMIPARVYQRYYAFFDRLLPSLGMAWLFLLTDQATGLFSSEWRLFIAGGVLAAGLVAPIAGYILFILALVYPLYSVSIYVAALALTVLILSAFFMTRHVAAMVLVLATPLLVTYRLAPVVPLLAGLLWAEWRGGLVGLGSVLWLKLFAGMCGATPDLVQLGGQPLDAHNLIARFQTADSLQTLLWMAKPLAPDSLTILLHLLEILAWGLVGYGVGLVHQRMTDSSRPNLALWASVGTGLLGLVIGSLALPTILGLRETSVLSISFIMIFLVEYCTSGVIVAGLYRVSRYLIRPAVKSVPFQVEPHRPSVQLETELVPQSWVSPQPREDEQTDIIMIDLD